MRNGDSSIEERLDRVRRLAIDCLNDTPLSPLLPEGNNVLGSGKSLRARLTLLLGAANEIPPETLEKAAATVEIIHGASLLHDDVIDGGLLRRNAPTFWKRHGVNGAILLGDLLVFRGLALLASAERPDLLEEMIRLAGEVCRSEAEQEILLRGTPGTWEACEGIARSKTGSLFAFAALAAGDGSEKQADLLRECGFLLGTAYQLSDDLLDASGDETLSGKTLGKDRERGKTTAATALRNAPEDPVGYMLGLLDEAAGLLAPLPDLHAALSGFLDATFRPLLLRHAGLRGA